MSLPGRLLSHIQFLKNPIFDRTTPLTGIYPSPPIILKSSFETLPHLPSAFLVCCIGANICIPLNGYGYPVRSEIWVCYTILFSQYQGEPRDPKMELRTEWRCHQRAHSLVLNLFITENLFLSRYAKNLWCASTEDNRSGGGNML